MCLYYIAVSDGNLQYLTFEDETKLNKNDINSYIILNDWLYVLLMDDSETTWIHEFMKIL